MLCVCSFCPSEDMSWMAAETLAEGPTPETRIGHTATFDPDSKRIFVFGGSKNRKWFNDVHILDTQTWRWSMVEVRPASPQEETLLLLSRHPPPPSSRLRGRFPHWPTTAAACSGGSCSCWGACFPAPTRSPTAAATPCTSLIHSFPSGTSQSSPGTSPPPAQGEMDSSILGRMCETGVNPFRSVCSHSACVIQQRYIYVFGGWDTPVCYNDMYMLDLGERRTRRLNS